MHVHYTESIAKLLRMQKLTAAQVAALYMLWACVRDPFAETPTVHMSRGYMAARIGCTEDYVKKLLNELQRASALNKGVSVKGRGTAITLLRPVLGPEDEVNSPFEPDAEEDTADKVVKKLRADGLVVKPTAKPKPVKKTKPAIKLSDIALTIEDAVGYTRKDNGKPHNRYARGSASTAWIAAAQRFINAHDVPTFERVCKAYSLRREDKPLAKRVYFFDDDKLVAKLLLAPTVAGGPPLEDLVLGFVQYGADETEARALLTKHWPKLAGMGAAALRKFVKSWLTTTPRPPLTSLFQDLR